MSKKTTAPSGEATLNAGYKDVELDHIVMSYCRKMGYLQSVAALKAEAKAAASLESATFSDMVNSNADVAGHVMMFNGNEIKSDSYDLSYTALKEWIGSSLQAYKVW
ncbi:hypothetical protein SARC_16444 [Sphaeroforma arctica JP610]|uniref:Uncharacterized protein n=1 Tax=Sphaeroforma arctica JP610 TaxID=667725 RepID=A0A0L0F4B9_9EUKA|nr:hypothetical protein SARC_16444 [Sphaeroforma arctica JP610]KNC71023.1 hypothetical protein SARC_16444 [Sphaeroforma arctica JP610]|eukprot:XP_014144925.1 hypothetical protein SARC_16444 [Sphaeroforma arctica JP610]